MRTAQTTHVRIVVLPVLDMCTAYQVYCMCVQYEP